MKEQPDAAEGRWLPNKTWIVIIGTIVALSFVVMNKYWELKAADVQIIQQHELFKQSVDSKFDAIILKLDEIKPK